MHINSFLRGQVRLFPYLPSLLAQLQPKFPDMFSLRFPQNFPARLLALLPAALAAWIPFTPVAHAQDTTPHDVVVYTSDLVPVQGQLPIARTYSVDITSPLIMLPVTTAISFSVE